ncbi:MAG: DUF4363 family protein [Anaerovorax sp.]
MRSLVASSLCVLLIFAAWITFSNFADQTLHQLMTLTDDQLLTTVVAEDWTEAKTNMDHFTEKWHDYKVIYSFFLNTEDINNTDYAIARSTQYIKAQDVSNAAGELACIKEQLKFLHLKETLSLENIF